MVLIFLLIRCGYTYTSAQLHRKTEFLGQRWGIQGRDRGPACAKDKDVSRYGLWFSSYSPTSSKRDRVRGDVVNILAVDVDSGCNNRIKIWSLVDSGAIILPKDSPLQSVIILCLAEIDLRRVGFEIFESLLPPLYPPIIHFPPLIFVNSLPHASNEPAADPSPVQKH